MNKLSCAFAKSVMQAQLKQTFLEIPFRCYAKPKTYRFKIKFSCLVIRLSMGLFIVYRIIRPLV